MAPRGWSGVVVTVALMGLMRGPEGRNPFTPADNPAQGRWYTRDPAAIAAYFRLDRTAPFTIDADDDAGLPGGWPRGNQTLVDIPNNHLSYALTWFGLAATLAGVFGAYVYRGRKAGSTGRFESGRAP